MNEMQNSPEEMAAVDKGVQAALPKDARWFRREARRLLIGKEGLDAAGKIERMKRARAALDKAIALMESGEIID